MNDDVQNIAMANENEEEDELLRLVTSNSDSSSQYVIFRNGSDELFALNIAKIEELIDLKEIHISKSNSEGVISGTAKIRGAIVPIVIFDAWLGKPELPLGEYELVIMCNYGNQQFGVIIKNVLGIMNIESKSLQDNSEVDEKTAYVTEITLGGITGLCFLFDSDKFLLELFPSIKSSEINKTTAIDTQKKLNGLILHAEDSAVIRSVVKPMYENNNIDYEFFQNGQLLLDRLVSIKPEEIALIITDIEMPVMDGLALISAIKELPVFADVPIIVNTNMGNNSIVAKAESLGALFVIHKLDLNGLSTAIFQYGRTK